MNPGIHPNTSWEDYFALDALNHSVLKKMAQSPFHANFARRHGGGETRPQFLGTAKHTMLLEPDTFDSIYKIAPESDRRKKPYKDFAKKHPTSLILTPDELAQCKAARKNCMADPDIRDFLSAPGLNEVTVVWERDGILCKARLDAIRPDIGGVSFLGDIKNMAVDLSNEHQVSNYLYNYAHHSQLAWYRDGIERASGVEHDRVPVILAVESAPPNAPRLLEIDEESIEIGTKANTDRFNRYRNCLEKDSWPSYPGGALPIGIPAFARGRDE
jgi:hypothetical protein